MENSIHCAQEAATHPYISVIQPCRQIQQFLTPVRGADRSITAAVHHDAIPQKDIEWLYDFLYNGESGPVPFSDAIRILRRAHFPFHYDPQPWVSGVLQVHVLRKKQKMNA